MLRLGSLFSGIGGIELGFEATGHFKTVWQVENDPYALGVLERHWPEAERHEDIRDFAGAPADVIAGGFPCQDISQTGRGAGIEGTRSGLWSEYARIVGVVRPRVVVVENVPMLLRRGMGRVLGDLAALGYDAEWDCIPAAAVGAPHRRDRLFILAYANGGGHVHGETGVESTGRGKSPLSLPLSGGPNMADSGGAGLPDHQGRATPEGLDGGSWLDGNSWRPRGHPGWGAEPSLGRVAHGVPDRVDRLRCLGNAVVPQVAEHIAWRVLGMIGQEGVA